MRVFLSKVQKDFATEAQRGGAARESQKAKGKTQKSKVKGRPCKNFLPT
jgi:hypothetical protein